MKITRWFLVFVLLTAPAIAQDDPPPPEEEPRVVSASAKAGPIEFHVLPEIGVGLLLKDDQIITRGSASDSFFVFRIPGLQFPGFNETTTGIQIEFSAPSGVAGIRYDIVSYTRTKIAGPAYTGANIRIAAGDSSLGASFQTHVSPIIGIRFMTIAGHVPFFLEFEFLDTNKPVKASFIVTWE